MTNNVLLRRAGGCGGDTVAQLLSRHMDRIPDGITWDDHNRGHYMDQFDRVMITDRPAQQLADLCGIRWQDCSFMDQDSLSTFVRSMRNKNPDKRIGLSHYRISNSINLRKVFVDTVIVDLLYEPQDWWLAEIMHLAKTYMRRHWELPDNIDSYLYADHIRAHFSAVGWVPVWLISSTDCHWSYENWLDGRHYIAADRRKHIQSNSDLMVSAGQLLTDTSLTPFMRIMDHLHLGPIAEHDQLALRSWVEGNLRIIVDLGAQSLMGSNLDRNWQKHEVNRIMLANYDRLLSR